MTIRVPLIQGAIGQLTGLDLPTSSGDAANKSYVDSKAGNTNIPLDVVTWTNSSSVAYTSDLTVQQVSSISITTPSSNLNTVPWTFSVQTLTGFTDGAEVIASNALGQTVSGVYSAGSSGSNANLGQVNYERTSGFVLNSTYTGFILRQGKLSSASIFVNTSDISGKVSRVDFNNGYLTTTNDGTGTYARISIDIPAEKGRIDERISSLIGSNQDPILQFPDTTLPIIASLGSSVIVLDDRLNGPLLINKYLWVNNTATGQANTVLVTGGANSGAFQYTLTVTGSPITAGFTVNSDQIYYSNTANPNVFNFQNLPTAAINKLSYLWAKSNVIASTGITKVNNDANQTITLSQAASGIGGAITIPPYSQNIVGSLNNGITTFNIETYYYQGKAYVFCPMGDNTSGGSFIQNGLTIPYSSWDINPDALGYSFVQPNSFGSGSSSRTINITGMTANGSSTVTITTLNSNSKFYIGSLILISGANSTVFNGQYFVTNKVVGQTNTTWTVTKLTGSITATWISGGVITAYVVPYISATFRTVGNTFSNMQITTDNPSGTLNVGFVRYPYLVSEACLLAARAGSINPTLTIYQHPLLQFSNSDVGNALEGGIINPSHYSGLSVSGNVSTISTYYGSQAIYSLNGSVFYDSSIWGDTRWYLMYEIICPGPVFNTANISNITFGSVFSDGSIEFDLELGNSTVNNKTWSDYVTRWDNTPSLLTSTGNANILGLTYTGSIYQYGNIYRFVPSNYSSVGDSFWEGYNSTNQTVSNIIVQRSNI